VKSVVQRVTRGEVRVAGRSVARIGAGTVILLGVLEGDTTERASRLAERIARLRIFPDGAGRMNRSLLEAGGEALVVSQITLAADCRKGRRPSLDGAAAPRLAAELVEHFARALGRLGVRIETGVFGERMEVELVNEGPVTFVLDEID
jgi:D-tyrosyl-tRNA(Tyr) deacylase